MNRMLTGNVVKRKKLSDGTFSITIGFRVGLRMITTVDRKFPLNQKLHAVIDHIEGKILRVYTPEEWDALITPEPDNPPEPDEGPVDVVKPEEMDIEWVDVWED